MGNRCLRLKTGTESTNDDDTSRDRDWKVEYHSNGRTQNFVLGCTKYAGVSMQNIGDVIHESVGKKQEITEICWHTDRRFHSPQILELV